MSDSIFAGAATVVVFAGMAVWPVVLQLFTTWMNRDRPARPMEVESFDATGLAID